MVQAYLAMLVIYSSSLILDTLNTNGEIRILPGLPFALMGINYVHKAYKFPSRMKKTIQSTVFIAAMFWLALGCQSKKKEETTTRLNDTTTMVQSETIVGGPDSGVVIQEKDQLITPDSTKK
jgi:hypothetical protein